MSALTFIAGMGAGATLAVAFLILTMKAWSANHSKASQETIKNNQQNTDLLDERNEIGREQVAALNHIARLICRHRNVTVADIATCDDCGAVVDYDKESRNWK